MFGNKMKSFSLTDLGVKRGVFQKFQKQGCTERLFSEMRQSGAIENYDRLFEGYVKGLPRFKGQINTFALMLCISGDVKAIDYGIKKELITPSLTNTAGNSPIHLAALIGHAQSVEKLLSGIKLDPLTLLNNRGANVLHCAAMGNSVELITLLIEKYKVPVDSKDSLGQNALDYACMAGASKTIDYLFKLGLRTDLDKIKHVIKYENPNATETWKQLHRLIENDLKEKKQLQMKDAPVKNEIPSDIPRMKR